MITLSHFRSLEELIHALERERKLLQELSFYLLIPSDIKERLQKGSTERYNNQYLRFKHITKDMPEVQQLIDLINRYHRCYDQEGYVDWE